MLNAAIKNGKTQPLLRKEEFIASIRAWRCNSEAGFDDRKKACAEFRKIADTGMMRCFY